MALTRMAFENYRCFKDRQEIELRPITLVLGKNNSGKSAVARFPLVLQAGLRTGSDLPLDLDQLGDDPPEFLDLVYGKNIHRPLKIEFSTRGRNPGIEYMPDGYTNSEYINTSVQATIQNIDERKIQVVSELKVAGSVMTTHLRWRPDAGDSEYENLRTLPPSTELYSFGGIIPYKKHFHASSAEHPRELEGFDAKTNPEVIEDSAPPSEAQEVSDTFGRVRYLGPYRNRPLRYVRLPSRLPREVGPMGENASAMLANDHARGDQRLVEKVNELLGGHLGGWRFEVVTLDGTNYAINLRSDADPALTVNILDSGTGVAQVLPLLVQQAQDLTAPPGTDVLQVIEEPELHLHPAFHPLLADLLITAAAEGSRFLIETHSENLLLRIRRRIAEQKVSADDVAVYFVEHEDGASQVRQVRIDGFGNVDYWPSGVFSEDYEETRELAKAQFSRERDAG